MPSPPTVLVVEDEPAQSDLVRDILESDGYQVESVADGVAALARIDAGGIDLVILDIGLPDVDGLAVCQSIRTPERANQPPIIMMSALPDETIPRTVTAVGADEYITKPFDLNELLATVARHCPINDS